MQPSTTTASGCPVQSPPTAGKCPVQHGSTSDRSAGKCPVQSDAINPLNQMPELSQAPAPDQGIELPTERVTSTIPSGSGDPWMYPSPQQFYNALKRKGWETPEEEIEIMVDIHNHLNEEAWKEILQWEEPYRTVCPQPKLLRLRGRPNDLSPKARFAGWFWGSPRPFDRHDWYVDRCGKSVRYVIDYYSGPDEGETPVFFLDIRPALDSPGALFQRMRVGFQEWWNKGSSSDAAK